MNNNNNIVQNLYSNLQTALQDGDDDERKQIFAQLYLTVMYAEKNSIVTGLTRQSLTQTTKNGQSHTAAGVGM